jgi:hypothetical protein
VHLLVIVQNIYDSFNNGSSVALTVQHRIIAEEWPGEGKTEICNREFHHIEEDCNPIDRDVWFCRIQSSEDSAETQITLRLTTRKSVRPSVRPLWCGDSPRTNDRVHKASSLIVTVLDALGSPLSRGRVFLTPSVLVFVKHTSLNNLWIYQSFIYQLMHNKRISKFTLKQLPHVSVQSPSSGSVLFELTKVIQ